MKKTCLAFALLALCPLGAQAQSLQNAILRNSFSPVGAGARAAGMGGAFLAIADDGTAASFNPAGLAQLRKPELALVYYSDRMSTRFGPDDGVAELTEPSERHSVPQFFGIVKPFQVASRRLTVQLSYERTVDLVGEGSAGAFQEGQFNGSPFGFLIELQSTQEGATNTATVSAGYELSDKLMVGASVSYWIGEWTATGTEATSALARGGPPFVKFEDERFRFDQDHSLRGVNLNLGSLYRTNWFSIGGVLRLPFSGRYSVAEHTWGSRADAETLEMADFDTVRGMRTILHWPLTAGIGVAVRPLRGLTLAADATWTHWETMTVDNVPNGALLTEEYAVGFPLYIDRNYFDLFPAAHSFTGSTGQFRVGGEYLVNVPRVVIPLRGGYAWEESPVPDLGRLESRPSKTWTFGFGVSFRRLALDFAFERRVTSGIAGAILTENADKYGVVFPEETVTQDRATTSIIVRF